MPKSIKIILAFSVTVGLLFCGFIMGFLAGGNYQPNDENFLAIKQAWDTINKDYVEQDKIDASVLSQVAIEAMISALEDPYSAYLNPQMYQMEMEDSNGKFEGIGAEVSIRAGAVTIVAPYPGSPADKAGVKAGDVITAVDGVTVENLSLLDVITTEFVDLADYVAVNDYEGKLLEDKTGRSMEKISAGVKALILTLGSKGSLIYAGGRTHEIPIVKPTEILDPTGCGDAYRAGLLYGIANDWDWPSAGRLGALMGSIKIECRGAQNHEFQAQDIRDRFKDEFGYSPW